MCDILPWRHIFTTAPKVYATPRLTCVKGGGAAYTVTEGLSCRENKIKIYPTCKNTAKKHYKREKTSLAWFVIGVNIRPLLHICKTAQKTIPQSASLTAPLTQRSRRRSKRFPLYGESDGVCWSLPLHKGAVWRVHTVPLKQRSQSERSFYFLCKIKSNYSF